MGECLIKRAGSSIDASDATATAKDVLTGRTFLLQDGDTTGVGVMTEQGSPSKDIPINGEVTLPEGHYSGGKVTQNIPTFPGQTVNTGKNPVTVSTANKYASGNIQLTQIKNLTPAVIKKGMYVAGVGPGTWEGFINNNADWPYYYGTFGPGWSTTNALAVGASMLMGDFELNKGQISLYSPVGDSSNNYRTSGVGFAFLLPINWSLYKRIRILADFDDGYEFSYTTNIRMASGTYLNMSGPIWSAESGVTNIGTKIFETSFNANDNGQEKIIDVSGYTSTGYLYFTTRSRANTPQLDKYWDVYLNISYVKLER